MERWNLGILGIKSRESDPLVQERFAEARGKEFLAFSLKSAAGGRSSTLFQGDTYA
jgi:hypothetical protein